MAERTEKAICTKCKIRPRITEYRSAWCRECKREHDRNKTREKLTHARATDQSNI